MCYVQETNTILAKQVEEALAVLDPSLKETLFDRLGGQAAVVAAAEILYRNILADNTLKQFFAHLDMKVQQGKMVKYLTFVLKGAGTWTGKSMYDAHKHLNLTEDHFNSVAGHLLATFEELNLPQNLVNETMAVAASVKPDILGWDRSPGDV